MSNDLLYFPNDYADSRRGFLERIARLGNAAGLERGTWKIPSRKDDDLFVDYAYLPALRTPERLFLIISGVHGLEAYAGAAIQFMFMDEILSSVDRSAAGIVLIHSFNPYGFKHHMRGTESHVNLNRNFSSRPQLYQYCNPESLKVSERFIPKEPVTSKRCRLLESIRFHGENMFFDDTPMDQLIKAVGPGQFEDPMGLEYGGQGPEPQTMALVELLRRIQPAYRDVVAMDLHTGLGDRGRLHLIPGEERESLHPALFSELFHFEADREIYDFTPGETEGFYKVAGASNDLFMELGPRDQRIVALTMEFGTLGHSPEAKLESLNRWLIQHQGTHYGYADSEIEAQVKADYLDKFYPNDPEWSRSVVSASRETFTSVLSRAKTLLRS